MTTATEVPRLCKSRSGRMIDGVCGGIAEYLGVDSTLVRLGFIFLAFLGGLGVLLYIAAMIVMPAGNGQAVAGGERNQGKMFGIVLIGVGALLLLGKIGFSFWHGWWHLPWEVVIPLAFIGGGAALIAAAAKKGNVRPAVQDAPEGGAKASPAPEGLTRLYRSRTDRKLFGVCGGIGMYLNTDPTLVRILFILAALASAGLIILLYIIMALVVPTGPAAPAATPLAATPPAATPPAATPPAATPPAN